MQPSASPSMVDAVVEKTEEDTQRLGLHGSNSKGTTGEHTSRRHTLGYSSKKGTKSPLHIPPVNVSPDSSKRDQQDTKPPSHASLPQGSKANSKPSQKVTIGDRPVHLRAPAPHAIASPPKATDTEAVHMADGFSQEFERFVETLKHMSSQLSDLQAELRREKEKNRQLELKNQELANDLERHKEEQLRMKRKLEASEAKQISDEAELRVMHLKLARAEKAVRVLDHVTNLKVEARIHYHLDIPPSTSKSQKPQHEINLYIVLMMEDINDMILETALAISNTAVRSKPHQTNQPDNTGRRLGVHLRSLLVKGSQDAISNPVSTILVQAVVQVLLVRWCVDIIEAHYPPRKTFSDLLIEMTAQPQSTGQTVFSMTPFPRTALWELTDYFEDPLPICGPQSSIVTPSHPESQPPFKEWTYEILASLNVTLNLGGYALTTLKSYANTLLKLEKLVKLAYDTRRTLAERDKTGGLEILVVEPDTEFMPRMMEDAYLLELDKKTTKIRNSDLLSVGTTAIGLQKEDIDPNDDQSLGIEVVLRPKVVLYNASNTSQPGA